MNRMLIVCGMVALLATGSMAHPSGAPSAVCNDRSMKPTFHVEAYNAAGVNNTNEYTLTSQPVEGNQNLVRVTLSGPTFLGFVLRATTTNGEDNLGKFVKDENSISFKKLDCQLLKDVAVTHVDPRPKTSITLLWEDNNNGNYVFQATTVQDLFNYVYNIV